MEKFDEYISIPRRPVDLLLSMLIENLFSIFEQLNQILQLERVILPHTTIQFLFSFPRDNTRHLLRNSQSTLIIPISEQS